MCSTHFASNHSNAQDHISTTFLWRIFRGFFQKMEDFTTFFCGSYLIKPQSMEDFPNKNPWRWSANCDARRLHGVQSGQLLLPPRQCIGLERPNLWYIMTMYDRYHIYIWYVYIIWYVLVYLKLFHIIIYNVLYNDRWW